MYRHRRESKDQFNGVDYRVLIVMGMNKLAATFDIRADHKSRCTVSVDMILTVLAIVLDNEDDAF